MAAMTERDATGDEKPTEPDVNTQGLALARAALKMAKTAVEQRKTKGTP